MADAIWHLRGQPTSAGFYSISQESPDFSGSRLGGLKQAINETSQVDIFTGAGAATEQITRRTGNVLQYTGFSDVAAQYFPGAGIAFSTLDFIHVSQKLIRDFSIKEVCEVLFTIVLMKDDWQVEQDWNQSTANLKAQMVRAQNRGHWTSTDSDLIIYARWVLYKYKPQFWNVLNGYVRKYSEICLSLATAIIGLLAATSIATLGTSAIIMGAVGTGLAAAGAIHRGVKTIQSHQGFQLLQNEGIVTDDDIANMDKYMGFFHRKVTGLTIGDWFRYKIGCLLAAEPPSGLMTEQAKRFYVSTKLKEDLRIETQDLQGLKDNLTEAEYFQLFILFAIADIVKTNVGPKAWTEAAVLLHLNNYDKDKKLSLFISLLKVNK